ncbi:MAG: ArsR family transcriptional regulator [Desulfovibrio sp.]|uniref:VpaChn25_0724 family phage protein n=1 Tax=Desulfovibrio sp. TaxID=885 RepID=UPI001A752D3C|nr:ArsR family transcriptional regulator [Desulfovibrio sp.]MBD5416970.1 ArsR family transcriptional regulator [Desulfovibrio sp.]
MSYNAEFQERLAQDRRLVILRFLAEEADGRMSASVMQDALELMAHRVPRVQVMEDASYLEERGLLRVEYVGTVPIFRVTSRGVEVARGLVVVPGIKRPRLGD